MRLKTIKMSGFKSFVDPTVFHLPSNLIGVVGPNGCGKSNIIDAVRWVMGESSARHLRGESMSDVIFNGSNVRKPVGTATVELVFDNSDGKVQGEYARFTEISIKRQVGRDGHSQYFLQNARCRRRDITDLFLGTGLGARSYSIIEQGMISQIVEARPEELRDHLEEAAGISKYKERRRETSNRIRHTRENLERLDDLRAEVDKQLQHLDRQAKQAEKYKELKSEFRYREAQLFAVSWRELQHQLENGNRLLAETENLLQAEVARLRKVESDIESCREEQNESRDHTNKVQAELYEVAGEIARLEQAIEHRKDLSARQRKEHEEAERNWQELQEHLDLDRVQVEDLKRQIASLEPELEQARAAENEAVAAAQAAESDLQEWQKNWQEFSQASSELGRAADVERTRIDHLDRQLAENAVRLEGIQAEGASISTDAVEKDLVSLEQKREAQQARVRDIESRLDSRREELGQQSERLRSLEEQLAETRESYQETRGRLSSLDALQQAALSKDQQDVSDWLARHGLEEAGRLAETIQVEPGWERAVETALGHFLEAIVADQPETLITAVQELDQGELALVDSAASPDAGAPAGSLAEKVTGSAAVASLLTRVRAAASLGEALEASLQPGESVMTQAGEWLGPGWVRVSRGESEQGGVIEREREIQSLRQQLEQLGSQGENQRAEQQAAEERISDLEDQRDGLVQDLNMEHRRLAEIGGQLEARKARQQELARRRDQLGQESNSLTERISADTEAVKSARGKLQTSVDRMADLEQQREALEQRRDQVRQQHDQTRSAAGEARNRATQLAIQKESRNAALTSTEQALERISLQINQLDERRRQLISQIESADEPLESEEKSLKELLDQRLSVDQRLTEARNTLDAFGAKLRELEQQRAAANDKEHQIRARLEQQRLDHEGTRVKSETLQEQLDKTGIDRQELLESLPEQADSAEWARQLERLEARIRRMEPVNLAAIQEFQEQSERKEYLDSQNADLVEALETLEAAIRKIDRKTRTRFKETFDRVNTGVQELFPRLFGGGHAYMDLTGDDLLTAGVTLMARPPGKRITNIHLLSGGEKALTAVSFVFAIFQLNPAPFCLLDEVDAPLDDANVGRFSEMVSEMSEQVQFLFVTHNKITMEVAHQLTGVTMREPGVSRMVSVDIAEAEKMASE